MNKKNNLFVGIDVSKLTVDISFGGKHLKINNNAKELADFINKEFLINKELPTLACLESTGGYEREAMQAFWNASIPIHRAHPNKVHAFAKVAGHFAKTDKLDSKLLEKYAAFISSQENGDPVVMQPTIELQELRNVERRLMEDLHASQCRLQFIKGCASKYLLKQIKFIKQQIGMIRGDIDELINTNEYLKEKRDLLISYKGVGKQISHALLAELPELGNLNKKEIASLVGVAPKLKHSGINNPNGHIFGGRFYVRKALYMAALVAIRYNERMKSFYQRLVGVGKAKKIALTAVMRKIIICLNSMLKNNAFYA